MQPPRAAPSPCYGSWRSGNCGAARRAEKAAWANRGQMKKGRLAPFPNFLICLARPAGFEPTTPWFVGAKRSIADLKNQRLVTLATAQPNLLQPQLWHSQSSYDAFSKDQRESCYRIDLSQPTGCKHASARSIRG